MRTREEYLTVMMWILFVAVQVTKDPVSIALVIIMAAFILAEALIITWRKNRKNNND